VEATVDATLVPLVKSPSMAVIEWSTEDYRILRWNGDAPEMFGWSEAEVVGRRVDELNWIHPEDRPRGERDMADMICSPRVHNVQRYRHLRKDGSVLECEWHNSSIHSEAGPSSILSVVADLTARSQAERALRASEERYRTLFDAIPDGIAIVGSDGLIKSANQAECRMFRYSSPAELVGLSPVMLVAANMRDVATAIMRRRLGGEEIATVEYRLVRKDGSQFWGETEAAILRNADGTTAGYIWITRDISQRKQAEATLRDSEERFRVVQELSPDGFAILRPVRDAQCRVTDFIFVYENAAIAQLNGTDPKAVVGRRVLELLPSRRGLPLWEAWRSVAETGIQRVFEGEYEGRQGTLWIRMVVVPLGGDIAIVVQDFTERKRAEQSLRQSQAALQAFYDNAPMAMGMVELHGDEVIAVHGNRRVAALFGTTPDELPGRAFGDITANPEIGALWLQAYRRSHTENAAVQFEYERSTSAGASIWISATTSPVPHGESGALRCSVFAEDITARKQAEAQKAELEAHLREAQKMDAVGRLAGGVAHDFNNMLMVILGNTEQALSQVDVSRPLHEDLLKIQKAALRSARLTSQLLAFARRQPVAPKILDLNDLIEATLTMLERLIGEDVTLTWTPGARLWPVRLDPAQVDQVLANLCVNARDAIVGVGRIAIATHNTTLGAACPVHPEAMPGDYVALSVSDTGSGMPKEILDQLFEPFFTTKALGRGTGLGLATVYGIVRQNGGFIDISSTPGVGTTFTVHLPRHAGEIEKLLPAGASESRTRGHATVLLVEDEPALLDLIARMLTRQGYTVLAATTGEEAIRMAREHPGEIQLLLTDVVLPELTGPAVLAQVLTFRPGIRHLFMSGYPADALEPRGVMEHGDLIRKPIGMSDLATRIRERLDRP
jgi:two-component system, cell cycle sensor histidine kinase and response regulator CckA